MNAEIKELEKMMDEIERDAIIQEAISSERRRVRRKEIAKRNRKEAKVKTIGLGLGLVICGIASFFIEFDATAMIFFGIMGVFVMFQKPEEILMD